MNKPFSPADHNRFYLVSALVMTGLILYIPSNVIPVMTMTVNGDVQALTVMGGVREMLESGLWPVALIIFLASIVVPFLKLTVMSALLLLQGRRWHQRVRSMLRRIMITIGSWAMIDIFLLSIIAAVGQLGMLASVHAEPGALFFAGVLLCNIFSYEFYKASWIWEPSKN
ncbi:MAG: paraquat-inducible protein A [Chthoniobacterales bacterium]|nr:paraquat-inducible protein A [Chthoniobacterales bacterium]